MRVLMLAPQPVFTPRGTPISVRDRCRLLAEMGHEVVLLTFPLGADFASAGLVIRRVPRPPGLRRIAIGFSWLKLALDGALFLMACFHLLVRRYDLLHSHEEAGMMGAILGRLFRTAHLYDMHSSLPQQFLNYQTSSVRPVLALMRWAERTILENADAVAAVCPDLAEQALAACPGAAVRLVPNLSQFPAPPPSTAEIERRRKDLAAAERFVVGYTGTLEVNQGLGLLVEAFAAFRQYAPEALLVLAGGEPRQVGRLRERCEALGIHEACRFLGRVREEEIASILLVCDVLVSPRASGTNTPLKIYTYLDTGLPVLATRIRSHTQVLDDSRALLVEPEAAALAQGLRVLRDDPSLRLRLGAASRAWQREHGSVEQVGASLAEAVELAVENAASRRRSRRPDPQEKGRHQ